MKARARGFIDGGDLGFIALLALLGLGMWLDHVETMRRMERGLPEKPSTASFGCSSKPEQR